LLYFYSVDASSQVQAALNGLRTTLTEIARKPNEEPDAGTDE
jgi:hypothetical protein